VSQSRPQIKMGDKSFKTIPYKEEILNLIEEAHNGYQKEVIKHNGIKVTIENLLGPKMCLYWANMTLDVKESLNSCEESAVKRSNGPFGMIVLLILVCFIG